MAAQDGVGPTVEIPGILHLDMDAFFASVEVRDHPELRGLPVVVGGAGTRGVVAAASYPARTRGIRSAMPMASARRLAPDLVIVPPRIARYQETSALVMELLSSVVADIEQISIDEAFLDVRGARRLFGGPDQIASLLRSRIRDELGPPELRRRLKVSRAVAKIASARAKPDGQLIIPAEQTAESRRCRSRRSRGSDRRRSPPWNVSGCDHRPDQGDPAFHPGAGTGPPRPRDHPPGHRQRSDGTGTPGPDKSLGTERTWDEDLTDADEVRRRITSMADDVARQLRRSDAVARTVVLKLRSPDGTTITRSSTLDQPTSSGERLREQVVALWDKERHRLRRIRLAGVRVTHLTAESTSAVQQELTSRSALWRDLETAMDRATDRFGTASLSRGSTLGPAADGAQRSASSRDPEDDRDARDGSGL